MRREKRIPPATSHFFMPCLLNGSSFGVQGAKAIELP
jgi:hypothetical protein